MTGRANRRGKPLVALVLVLGSWVGARAMTWDAVAARHTLMTPVFAVQDGQRTMTVPEGPFDAASAFPTFMPVWNGNPGGSEPVRMIRPVYDERLQPGSAPRDQLWRDDRAALQVQGREGWFDSLLPMNRESAAPPVFMGQGIAPDPAPGGNVAPAMSLAPRYDARPTRWSGDAWMLVRKGGSGTLAGGMVPPVYGANQAGAVLRYGLAPANGHRPTVYGRITSALDDGSEAEAAAGFSARPLPSLPLIASAELRVSRNHGETRLRPAVMAVTQLAPFALPFGTSGEAYAQGGYVAGSFATPFIDGQLRIDRKLARIGAGDLRVGVGGWGGAQKGVSRLDVGPAASLGVPLGGHVSARVAVDWRLRVAGNAEPPSGPALTLSAGF